MDTLKLTTLTLLVPLGWSISAEAYPQLVERSNSSAAATCHMPLRSTSATAREDERGAADKGALKALEAEQNTSDHRDTNTLNAKTCRLKLDPIEIN